MVRRRPVLTAMLGTLSAILILASGCVDQSPTASLLEPGSALSAARPYSGGTYTASIGTDGGILNFPIGQIEFPAGAVEQTTLIRAKLDGRTLSVDFHPHLEFPEDARPTLTISYRGVNIAPSHVVVLHFDDAGRFLGTYVPAFDLNAQTASVQPTSFSKWALATQ